MENKNKSTIVIEGTFNEGGMQTKEFEEYSKGAADILMKYKGNVISKFPIEQNLSQGDTPNIVLIVEFPSKEKAIQAFTCEEYKNLLPLRGVALKEVKILVAK